MPENGGTSLFTRRKSRMFHVWKGKISELPRRGAGLLPAFCRYGMGPLCFLGGGNRDWTYSMPGAGRWVFPLCSDKSEESYLFLKERRVALLSRESSHFSRKRGSTSSWFRSTWVGVPTFARKRGELSHGVGSKWPASYCVDGNDEARLPECWLLHDVMGYPWVWGGGVIAKEALVMGYRSQHDGQADGSGWRWPHSWTGHLKFTLLRPSGQSAPPASLQPGHDEDIGREESPARRPEEARAPETPSWWGPVNEVDNGLGWWGDKGGRVHFFCVCTCVLMYVCMIVALMSLCVNAYVCADEYLCLYHVCVMWIGVCGTHRYMSRWVCVCVCVFEREKSSISEKGSWS